MKKTVLRLVVALVAIGFVALLTVRIVSARRERALAEKSESDPVTVGIAAPSRRDVGVTVRFTGVVRPRSEVEVFTKIPGRVEKLSVEVGERVEAGKELAVIEHREIVWQTRQAGAQAKAAAAAVEQARTQLATTKTQHERFQRLRQSDAIPQAEYERAESAHLAAGSALQAAESQLALAQATAGLSREALRNTKITAPIAGTITKRAIDVGTQTSPAQALFQIQDVSTLELGGAVPAGDFVRLRAGQVAKVAVDELPGRTFQGRVSVLSPSLDPQTRRASVEVVLDDPAGMLLPNMFATVEIETDRRAAVLVVPAAAVVGDGADRHVFVFRDGHAALVRPALAEGDGDFVPIESGLAETDRVIVSGVEGLSEGAAVRVGGAAP